VSISSLFSPIADDTLFPLAGLYRANNCAPSTLYYARVRARNASGWSAWSPQATFTTLAAPAGNIFYAKEEGVWRMVQADYTKVNAMWDDISQPAIKIGAAWDT